MKPCVQGRTKHRWHGNTCARCGFQRPFPQSLDPRKDEEDFVARDADPLALGYDAALAGKKRGDCPYRRGVLKFYQWMSGFLQGREDRNKPPLALSRDEAPAVEFLQE